MAAAQQANKFKDEIVPMKTRMKVVDKATKAESTTVATTSSTRTSATGLETDGRPRCWSL